MSVWDTSDAVIDLIPDKLGVHCLLARRSAIRANHITGQRSAAVGGGERVKRQNQWSETAMMWWTGGQQQLLGACCVPAEALDRLWHLVSAGVRRHKPRDTAAGRSGGRPRFWRHQVRERGDAKSFMKLTSGEKSKMNNWRVSARGTLHFFCLFDTVKGSVVNLITARNKISPCLGCGFNLPPDSCLNVKI